MSLELKSQRRATSALILLSAVAPQPETSTVPPTPSVVAVGEDAAAGIATVPSPTADTAVETEAASISPSPLPIALPALVCASSSPSAGAGESNHPLQTPPHVPRGRGGGRGRGSQAGRSASPRVTPQPDLRLAANASSSDHGTPVLLAQPSAAALEATEALQAEHSRFLKCCVGEFTKLVKFVVLDKNFAPKSRSVISSEGVCCIGCA